MALRIELSWNHGATATSRHKMILLDPAEFFAGSKGFQHCLCSSCAYLLLPKEAGRAREPKSGGWVRWDQGGHLSSPFTVQLGNQGQEHGRNFSPSQGMSREEAGSNKRVRKRACLSVHAHVCFGVLLRKIQHFKSQSAWVKGGVAKQRYYKIFLRSAICFIFWIPILDIISSQKARR